LGAELSLEVLGYVPEVVLQGTALMTMRSITMLARGGFRNIDLLRSRIYGYVKGSHVELAFFGNKPTSRSVAPEQVVWVAAQGFLKCSELWFDEWVLFYQGNTHIAREPVRLRGSTFLSACTWTADDEVIDCDTLRAFWDEIFGLAPFYLSSEEIKAKHWTPYGTRTILPSLAARDSHSAELCSTLGTWCSPTRTMTKPGSGMATRYAKNSAVVHVALDFKKVLLQRVHQVVGEPRNWREVVPLQRSEKIDYEFMVSPGSRVEVSSLGFSGAPVAHPVAKRARARDPVGS